MIFRSLISLFFILILSLIVLLDTDIGLALLIKVIPGKATAEQVSGTILHGGTIKKFNYKNDDFSLSFEEINFHWQWRELLKQNLVIDEVKVKKIELTLSQSSSKSAAINLSSINLPIDIYLKHVSLDDIRINTYLIKKVNLSGKVVKNIMTLNQFSVLTPDFSTSSNGIVNLSTWSNINFKNQFIFLSRHNFPIFTIIMGDKDALVLSMKAAQWLDINLKTQNYLEEAKNIIIQSNWFIDTNKAAFPELKKLNGKLQFSGSANGYLLHPDISGKLLAQNLSYNTMSIKNLNGTFSFTSDERQKIEFQLSGKNISFGATLLNTIQATISGTLKSHSIKVALQMLDTYFFTFSTQAGLSNQNSYFFKQGKLNIGPLNIILDPIKLDINLEKNKSLSYTVSAQHDAELLSLQGTTQLRFSNFETKLSLSSNQFTLINTNSYKIIAGPNLNLIYNNEVTKINGVLNIIKANISPVDFSNTVTLTSDIVYVNNQNQPLYPKSAPLKLFIDVLVKIKQLAINYKGLQADIIGETKLIQTPSTELNAYGQLQLLRGSYKAYGQELAIQKESTITFNREIDNPQLNVTASKNISVSPQYITLPSYQPYLIAGIQVTGTADEPIIHLFSIPSGITQQDILSYLIFGFPQSQLTHSQASALYSAFNMIDTGNSVYSLSSLQKNIQKEFGFSEFGLGNTSEYNSVTQQYETGTAFVVGKRITNNLTATYNVGLLVPVNVLYLRYQLTQRWALQSDSSALGNGGDILYTIRRD